MIMMLRSVFAKEERMQARMAQTVLEGNSNAQSLSGDVEPAVKLI
jgi:hypothetical protein